jgi:hypothetical protein
MWQICLAQWRAGGLGGDLGPGPMSSRLGLRIRRLDVGPCIIEC